MKVWQLFSVLRDEPEILNTVLSDSKWKFYKNAYERQEEIILNQNREILDQILPDEIVVSTLSKSKKVFCISLSKKKIWGYRTSWAERTISILDVYKNYGGNVVEEVCEKTEADFI